MEHGDETQFSPQVGTAKLKERLTDRLKQDV